MPKTRRSVTVWILCLTLTAACGGGDRPETPSPVPVFPPPSVATEEPRPAPVPEAPRPDPVPEEPRPGPVPEEPKPGPAPATYVLSGQLRATPLNEIVPDAQIEAVHGSDVVAATSRADGTYRMTGLIAQDYVLRVVKKGYNVQGINLLISGDTSRDIVMDRNRVTVQGFVSRAEPCFGTIDGVRVEILDGPDAGKSDVSGLTVRYRIQSVAWGTFRMRASKQGFSLLETSVTVPPPVAVAGETFETFFRIADQTGRSALTGEISNRLVQTGGQINGALIEFTRGPNAGRSTTSGSAGSGDGIYRFTGLLDGDASIQVSKAGFVTEYLNTAQICGDHRADFKLIPANASLSGVVRDEGGAPLAGARVERLSAGSGTPTGTFVSTDANGRYTITDLVGTFVSVRVSKAGYQSEDRKMTIGPNMPGDFTLKKAP